MPRSNRGLGKSNLLTRQYQTLTLCSLGAEG